MKIRENSVLNFGKILMHWIKGTSLIAFFCDLITLLFSYCSFPLPLASSPALQTTWPSSTWIISRWADLHRPSIASGFSSSTISRIRSPASASRIWFSARQPAHYRLTIDHRPSQGLSNDETAGRKSKWHWFASTTSRTALVWWLRWLSNMIIDLLWSRR